MSEHTPRNISCNEVLNFICEQFGEEDDDSERCRQVKQHLADCPDCGKYCTSMESMIGLYRVSSPEFPEHAKQILLNALGVGRIENG
jgi:hypothetical protein